MHRSIPFTYLIFSLSFLSLSSAAQEEEEKRKINVNGLHFFHQYSLEHSFAEFDKHQLLKAKTAFSLVPAFGIGIKKETPGYVFAFSSRFGLQRDNMNFSYEGQKLPGTYAMDYISVKRQFAFGLKIAPRQAFSFLVISSFNAFDMDAMPFGKRMNLRKLDPKDKLQISTTEEGFLDFRLGFEYELKPMAEKKLRLFFHFETALTKRRVEVEPNYNLGIRERQVLFYTLNVFGYGMRF